MSAKYRYAWPDRQAKYLSGSSVWVETEILILQVLRHGQKTSRQVFLAVDKLDRRRNITWEEIEVKLGDLMRSGRVRCGNKRFYIHGKV